MTIRLYVFNSEKCKSHTRKCLNTTPELVHYRLQLFSTCVTYGPMGWWTCFLVACNWTCNLDLFILLNLTVHRMPEVVYGICIACTVDVYWFAKCEILNSFKESNIFEDQGRNEKTTKTWVRICSWIMLICNRQLNKFPITNFSGGYQAQRVHHIQ